MNTLRKFHQGFTKILSLLWRIRRTKQRFPKFEGIRQPSTQLSVSTRRSTIVLSYSRNYTDSLFNATFAIFNLAFLVPG